MKKEITVKMNTGTKSQTETSVDKLKSEVLQRIRELDTWEDKESAHDQADMELIRLLKGLGCHEVAEAFDNMIKWYS